MSLNIRKDFFPKIDDLHVIFKKEKLITKSSHESESLIPHSEVMSTISNFYTEYHGHRQEHLRKIEAGLRGTFQEPRQAIYLAGDSSLDNKYWFQESAPACNGYEAYLEPPISKQDIAYWMNYEIKKSELGKALFCLNAAVEESSIGSRACGRLLDQDVFIRDTIQPDDTLVVSIGGNDIALCPSICTILNMLCLVFCTTTSCLKMNTCGDALPCDDCCCGCGPGFCSNFISWPPGYGYFLHLFGTRIKSYVEKLTSKTKPVTIIICMIYYPDELVSRSWADPALRALGYNSDPLKLQTLIDAVFRDAVRRIKISGSNVVGVPLSVVMNGKNTKDYCARVEPSALGGHKMATLILDTIINSKNLAVSRTDVVIDEEIVRNL